MKGRRQILTSISNVIAYAEEMGDAKLLKLANVALEIGMEELALVGREAHGSSNRGRPASGNLRVVPHPVVDDQRNVIRRR